MSASRARVDPSPLARAPPTRFPRSSRTLPIRPDWPERVGFSLGGQSDWVAATASDAIGDFARRARARDTRLESGLRIDPKPPLALSCRLGSLFRCKWVGRAGNCVLPQVPRLTIGNPGFTIENSGFTAVPCTRSPTLEFWVFWNKFWVFG